MKPLPDVSTLADDQTDSSPLKETPQTQSLARIGREENVTAAALQQLEKTLGEDTGLPSDLGSREFIVRTGGPKPQDRTSSHTDTSDLPRWATQDLQDTILIGDDNETEADSGQRSPSETRLKVKVQSHPSDSSIGDLVGHKLSGSEKMSGQGTVSSTSRAQVSDSSVKDILYPVPEENSRDKQMSDDPKQLGPAQVPDVSESDCVPGAGTGSSVNPDLSKLQPKTTVRAIPGQHISAESATMDPEPSKSSIRVSRDQHPSRETQEGEADIRRHTKASGVGHISKESTEIPSRPHVKAISGMSATKESETATSESSHIHTVPGKHVSAESEGTTDYRPHIKMSSVGHASSETAQTPIRIKKPSFFGHVSELSGLEYVIDAPRLKRHKDFHASMESDFFTYQVKSRPRLKKKVEGQDIAQESQSQDAKQRKAHVHSVPDQHVSKESAPDESDGVRKKRFLESNIHGHSSDSTVQRLLYGSGYLTGKGPEEKSAELEQQGKKKINVYYLL